MIHHQKSVVHKVPRVQKTLDTLTVQQQQQQYSITNPVNVDNVPSHASKSSFFKSQQAIPSITDAPAVVSTTQQPQNPINERHFNASIETGIPAGRADVFDTVEDLEEREESGKLGKPEVSEEKAEKTETVEKSEKLEKEGGETRGTREIGETGGSEKPEKLENQTRVIEESKGSEKPENQDVETVETGESKESEKSEKSEKPETPKSNDEDNEETVETAVPKSSNETVILTEIPTNSTALVSNSMEAAPSNSTTVSPGSNSLKPAKGASSKRKSSKQSRKGRNAKKSKRSSFIHSSNATNSTNSTIGREIVDPLEPINLSEVSSLGFNYSLYYRDHSSLPIRIETPTTKWISGSSILQNYVNDVFLPRQMNSVARASNPIIYVARNDARLEQQMIGICDVFLLSLLYHRPFQCLPFPRGNDL